MKKLILKILRFLIFFAIGTFIFWLIYKDQDIERIKSVLTNDVNYLWIMLSLIVGFLSHVSRTIRWVLMIEPIGHKPRFINTFLAVMTGYLMNLALPRMGEISRCGVLARYEKISFTKLIGTVVAERAVDMISLLILLLIAISAQFGEMLKFLHSHPEIESRLLSIATSPFLIIGLMAVIVLIVVFRKTLKHTILYIKVSHIATNLKEGFISIRSINKKGWFGVLAFLPAK